MSGAWTMTDDGEFILDPAFDEKVREVKRTLREKWLDTICSELAMVTSYDKDELRSEFISRVERAPGEPSVDIVDGFIIEALEGSIVC